MEAEAKRLAEQNNSTDLSDEDDLDFELGQELSEAEEEQTSSLSNEEELSWTLIAQRGNPSQKHPSQRTRVCRAAYPHNKKGSERQTTRNSKLDRSCRRVHLQGFNFTYGGEVGVHLIHQYQSPWGDGYATQQYYRDSADENGRRYRRNPASMEHLGAN